MRVVIGGGQGGGGSLVPLLFEYLSLSLFDLFSQLKFSSGLDPSKFIKICRSLTKSAGGGDIKSINVSSVNNNTFNTSLEPYFGLF